MGGAEGVVNEQVCQGGQLLAQSRVILCFTGHKAGVLQQHDFAVAQAGSQGLGIGPDDILRHLDRLPQQLRQPLCHDRQAQLRFKFPLGLAHMGAEDDLCAVVDQIPDRRQCGDDPLIAGNLARLQRHVKIAAAQHALALQRNVFYGFLVVIHIPYLLINRAYPGKLLILPPSSLPRKGRGSPAAAALQRR